MKAEYFNKIPDRLKKTLTDDMVVYSLINIKDDPYNPGKKIIPRMECLPCTEEIYDKETGKHIPIATIDRVKTNGEAVFGDIIFESINYGKIVLSKHNPKHHRWYQRLEISNYNVCNPERNPDAPALFKRIDKNAAALLEREKRQESLKAQLKASELNSDKLKPVAMALGINTSEPDEVVRNEVEKVAAKNPDKLLEIVKQEKLEVKLMLKEAVELQIITHDQRSHTFFWTVTEEVIFKYKKTVGTDAYLKFAEELEAKPDTLSAIKTRIAAEKELASKDQ